MLVRIMRTLISALFACLRALITPRASLALENVALRQQLAVYQRTHKRVKLQTEDRLFWVALRRLWPGWTRPLIVVKPATVIAWHRRGFKVLWRRKSHSEKVGRPRIPRKHISFIQRISTDHPEWGEDRIAGELLTKFGITHSTSTIRRYMVPRNMRPRGDQRWSTLVRNHSKELWACDFLTQHTAFYAVVYIFVIMEIHSRRIVHVNATSNPTLPWIKRQIRQATPGAWLPASSFMTMTVSSVSTAGQ
jgi:putative transposase